MEKNSDEISLLDTSTESLSSSISKWVNFPLKRYRLASTSLINFTKTIVNAHLYMHWTWIACCWRRGFDGNLRLPEIEIYAAEDNVLAILTEQINGGIQLRIDNHILSSSVSSRCFSVKVDLIIPSIESSARDILALMFGRKHNEFATTFGMKINGLPEAIRRWSK